MRVTDGYGIAITRGDAFGRGQLSLNDVWRLIVVEKHIASYRRQSFFFRGFKPDRLRTCAQSQRKNKWRCCNSSITIFMPSA